MIHIRWFSPRLTHSISTHTVKHSAFSDGLEGRSAQDRVHALLKEVRVAKLSTHFLSQLPQLPVVGIRHAREACSEPERDKHSKRDKHLHPFKYNRTQHDLSRLKHLLPKGYHGYTLAFTHLFMVCFFPAHLSSFGPHKGLFPAKPGKLMWSLITMMSPTL